MTPFSIELLEGPGQGRTFSFNKQKVRIGRAPDNDLVLVDGSVSRYHCELRVRGDSVHLDDAHSTNGVKLNGRKLNDIAQLRDLDIIELGRLRLRFHHGSQPSRESSRLPVGETTATSLLSTTQMLPAEGDVEMEAEAIAQEYQSATQLYTASVSEKVLQKRQEQHSQRSSVILLSVIATFALIGIISMMIVSGENDGVIAQLPTFQMDADLSEERFGTAASVTQETPKGFAIIFQTHLMRATFLGNWFAIDGDVEFEIRLNGVRVENLLVRIPGNVQGFSYSLPRGEIREGKNVLELIALGDTSQLSWWFDSLRVLESAPRGETCAGEADSRARLIGLLDGGMTGDPGSMYVAIEDLVQWETNCSATLSAARLDQTRSWIARGRSWLAAKKRKALFEAERALRIGNRSEAIEILTAAMAEFPELGTSDREDLKAKIRQLSIP